jgi:hypothetical protein
MDSIADGETPSNIVFAESPQSIEDGGSAASLGVGLYLGTPLSFAALLRTF